MRRESPHAGPLRALFRQFSAFAGVGLVAAVAHYGALIGLVEGAGASPVPATLAGYVLGGVVSYALNRRYAFDSDRPHREATWRFATVAGVGFVLTGLFMGLFNGRLGLPYLPAQVLTTGVVLLWSFSANRFWTFRP
ncbi:GtrA family protein [Alsobacter sp. SYSU M60028]|uniref:GtrA family protein n=1 Tax=Alsobacter ponti TaxID=2962936 RepID=A0ABT1L6P3_9HYPH|nr:GtrA family protein [Alsobacter ponti]MCP8937067.1 GtrA family protein [Alsobacter ponti]